MPAKSTVGRFLIFLALAMAAAVPGGAETASDRATLDRIYFQIALNVNYVPDRAAQRKTIQTVRRHLDLIDKHRIKANYYFTGLAAEMIQDLDPALIGLLKDKSKAKQVVLGHHGANRPPRPMPMERVKGQDWEEDVKAVLDYESCALDPATGAVDCSRPGGLKKMSDAIFGQPLFSTGRFFQASILHAAKLLGVRMAVGLGDNTGAPRGDAWFLGILNRPESIGIGPEIVLRWARGGTSPLPPLERRIAELDKSRIRLVSLLAHDYDFFRGLTASQEEQVWQKYEEFIKWALARGYVIVSLEDLYTMARDDRERTITRDELRKIAEFYVKQIDGSSPRYPPDYVDLADDYFSLADAWQALAQALAHYRQAGSLPEQVVARDILGPTVLVRGDTVPGTISAGAILDSAAAALARPPDCVPSLVRLEQAGITVNASEHLYLLAKEFLSLSRESPTPVELFRIRLISKNAEAIGRDLKDPNAGRADPLTRQQLWTFKPVRWGGAAAQDANENPIYVTFVIHLDPLPALGGQVLKQGYEQERDNLAWLADYLDRLERDRGPAFVPRLTLEIAGDHAEYYSEDPVGLALLKRLYVKGHSLGTHFHTNYKAGPHSWPDVRSQNTPENRRRVTSDHVAEVDALVAKILGAADAAAIRKANRTITAHFLDEELARQMGFDVLTGGRNEAFNLFFDHDVYTPWRPAAGPGAWPLAENLNSPWIVIPQAPVLGAIEEHSPLPAGLPPEYAQLLGDGTNPEAVLRGGACGRGDGPGRHCLAGNGEPDNLYRTPAPYTAC